MNSKDEFLRARTEEQREQRRTHILNVTRDMLHRHRLVDLSFNEIAKQVGLAKSNIMRYFDSRESILLVLLQEEYDSWVTEVEHSLKMSQESVAIERVSDVLSSTIMSRALLCELLTFTLTVLEHNVSTEEVIKFKLTLHNSIRRLMTIVEPYLGKWNPIQTGIFLSELHACVTHTWALTNPSPELKTAYESCPDIASMPLPPNLIVRETLASLMVGFKYRQLYGK